MLRALREEMQQLLAAAPAGRKPALRRTDAPDALLATDLPLIAEEDDLSAFVAVVMAQGWRVGFLPNGWMTLDHDVPVPDAEAMQHVPGEMGCCLSLVERHPDGEMDKAYIRALVKAEDAGTMELEKLCRLWHRDFARRLRMKQSLPGVLPYLRAAVKQHGVKGDKA